MAKEIKTEIIIEASTEKVWKILTDFKNYPNWNPFIKSIVGPLELGKKISARIEPHETNGMNFKPRITKIEKNKELSWLGHLLMPGLFDGEHKFQLIDNGNGTITFLQSEKFQGILVPFFNKMIDYNTKKGFDLMNIKLKEVAEGE
ncbi:SRPBCC domain-containing protein [Crocinitomix catalasitica]|uniref:SRPBCC domain-containing protein n=1 Tax=Crocinitomix catalasitica TaxID=184607 RepID=UPI000483F5C6|nr:SRPBCC domain-containing protein [Crocinitomix catalasitica]